MLKLLPYKLIITALLNRSAKIVSKGRVLILYKISVPSYLSF